jgi:hypothetical protein
VTLRNKTNKKCSYSVLRGTYFFKRECDKRLENSASATLATKNTQVRHAFLVTSLKAPVAKSLTSHLREFLARLDEGSGCSLPEQRVDPRAVSTAKAVSRIGHADASFMYTSRVPFPECWLCSFERKNAEFSHRTWLLGAKLFFGNRIREQRSLTRYSPLHLRLRNRGLVLGKLKTIFALPLHPDRLWSSPNHLFNKVSKDIPVPGRGGP